MIVCNVEKKKSRGGKKEMNKLWMRKMREGKRYGKGNKRNK